MTDERVTLLLLRHLFPAWTITQDEYGVWRAEISVSDVEGLLELLVLADPDAATRAAALLSEKKTHPSTPGEPAAGKGRAPSEGRG
ncbi:hypothetical protein E1200_24825, partial [Actinomadura sp. GC306]|uniref:hypothetical protein n=1 Tax=Actinomadura sp. GC306 TaxID=2530367 RepID=UPI001049F24B